MVDFAVDSAIIQRVKALKDRYLVRDVKARTVKHVKAGEWEMVAPGAFTEDYPAPMVANRIEVMGRDVSASLAPLPSVNCAASSSLSDAAKKFAEKRSKIANWYIKGSRLEAFQTDAASAYNDYGMLVYFIEPDLEAKAPRIRVRESSAVYAEWGADGRVQRAFEEFCLSPRQLIDLFPDAQRYLEEHQKLDAKKITLIRWSDRKETVVYLPECGNYPVLRYDAPIPGRSQYVCVIRPGGTGGIPRGAYDDLVYPQIADHEFRMLQLEGASKAVQSPLAVPSDVTDIPYGPDAVIRTQQPQNVRRVSIEIPNSAFAASQLIREDLAIGGMSPEARTGNLTGSIITGKGVEALSAGYSSQIANAQIMIAFALEQAVECCFMMDEHLWGEVDKEIRGVEQGAPFNLKYRPKKDIAGDHTVEISYGFLSGMAPNNALVFVLQAQAAGLISRDFAARQLPVGMNVNEEFNKIDVETMRNSLMQGMSALAQALPGMVQQGQDPTQVIKALADVVRGKQKGQPIEDVIAAVFAPKPPPPAPGSDAVAASDSAPAPGGAGGGTPPDSGLTPNLQTEGPNAVPDLSMMFAGTSRSGEPVLQGGISRRNPIQGQ